MEDTWETTEIRTAETNAIETNAIETNALLEELGKMGALAPAGYEGKAGEYLAAVRNFLEGQEFLRLGHCLNGKQWELAMMHISKLKKHVNQLGITCFDKSLMGLREAAAHRNRSDALQIMAQITAKRVKLRNVMGTMSTLGSVSGNSLGSVSRNSLGSASENSLGSAKGNSLGSADVSFQRSAGESDMRSPVEGKEKPCDM